MNFVNNPVLGCCETEGQFPEELRLQRSRFIQYGRMEAALLPMQLLHAQVMRQQFLYGQPVLRRMTALHKGSHISTRRWSVDIGDGLGQ